MSPELLKLHLAQLNRAVQRSKTNRYADPRKVDYHESLSELFRKLSEIDFENISYTEQKEVKKMLDFCFQSIEFLDNSTLVNIPYEIVYCLEKALNEWDDSQKYIIVTSLQNHLISYSFNPTLALNEPIYDLIKVKCGIEFSHRLVQINLPKYLAHDYLANVVLYHELGHFIDMKFQICARIGLALNLTNVETSHYEEFFSDLFASQYIGKASNYYLDYIAHGNLDCATHPATDKRVQLVLDFLSSTPNSIVDILKFATKSITTKELFHNNDKVPVDDIVSFIPPILENEMQLHSIFETGWDLWRTEVNEFREKNISENVKYQILNNLIEKSISNYMVMEKWSSNVSN